MESLAVKYRPHTFEDVVGQESTIKILKQEIDTGTFVNAYLFCGSSGCGKTTTARIFADAINKGAGSPIEIDGASNSGVDNVRELIKQAQERSLDSEYKIFVIDECHALSSQAWQAFLKTIEEPPRYTIFIFCTTESNKVPKTILNRVQRFNFSRFDTKQICDRLNHILNEEYKVGNVIPTDTSKQAVLSIAKMSNGGMRDAVTLLDTCLKYDKSLSVENVSKALGEYSYDTMFSVLNLIVDRNEAGLLTKLEEIYNSGSDMHLFVSTLLKFVLDVQKYFITNSIAVTSIPDIYEGEIKRLELQDSVPYYSYVTKNVLELLGTIKGVSDCSGFITIYLLKITRCE